MKILDPQSAILPTPELLHFLSTSHPRNLSRQKLSHSSLTTGSVDSAYPPPDLSGYNNIIKEFNDYIDGLASHVRTVPPAELWMAELVKRLGGEKGEDGYGLTKAEVLMVVELGLGFQDPENRTGENHEDEQIETVEGDVEDEAQRSDTTDGIGDRLPAPHSTHPSSAPPETKGEEAANHPDERTEGDIQALHAIVEELEERYTEAEIRGILNTVREVIGEAKKRFAVEGGPEP